MQKITLVFVYVLVLFAGEGDCLNPFIYLARKAADFALTATKLEGLREIVYEGLDMFEDFMGGPKKCSGIHFSAQGLENDLTNRLYGQHLVTSIAAKAINGHLSNPNPKKPLVLAFLGSTGTGKNYVSDFIKKNVHIFDKAGKEMNQHFHYFHPERHFKKKSVQEHKKELSAQVHRDVGSCGQAIFIFDEVELMPEGLLDALFPYLGHESSIDGVDFRKAIFIFLGTTGQKTLNELMLKRFKAGLSREDVKLNDVLRILHDSVHTAQGGLNCEVFKRNLIDHYIPFLPLERSHVRECVRDEFVHQRIPVQSKEMIDKIMDEILWYPEESENFSHAGCKQIEAKIRMYYQGH